MMSEADSGDLSPSLVEGEVIFHPVLKIIDLFSCNLSKKQTTR